MSDETKKQIVVLVVLIVFGLWVYYSAGVSIKWQQWNENFRAERATLQAACPLYGWRNVQCVYVISVTPTPAPPR